MKKREMILPLFLVILTGVLLTGLMVRLSMAVFDMLPFIRN
jgi:hypothetical protein